MSSTPNFSIPLLYAAQAQKEITHNEALVLIDALLAGVVEGASDNPAAISPAPGQAWIVGNAPVGPWSGKAQQIAVFAEGGWRFAPSVPGMRLFDRASGQMRIFEGGEWIGFGAIADASGGTVVDVEARAVLTAVLAALRQAGLTGVT